MAEACHSTATCSLRHAPMHASRRPRTPPGRRHGAPVPPPMRRRGGTIIGATLATGTVHGNGPSSARSAAVNTPQYAGNAACGGGIDASDGGVRVRRTHDLHPGLAGYVDVLDVLPASGQEARVFKSRERLTAEGHGSSWRSYPVVTRRAVSVIASSADEAIWMRLRMRAGPHGRGIASSLRSSQ